MRRRRARPGLAASGREEDDLLARQLRRLPGPRERPAVAEVLAVDADHAGVLVRRERLDELGGLDVGLIPERGEARDADAILRAEQAQLEREVATLGDDPEGAGGELVHAEVERCRCVVDAEAVRAEHHRSCSAHLVDHPALELLATLSDLAETGRDRDDSRAPAARASSTPASNAATGTAITTSSGGPGTSASERNACCPRISPPFRLTSQTSRRSAPRSAPAEIH